MLGGWTVGTRRRLSIRIVVVVLMTFSLLAPIRATATATVPCVEGSGAPCAVQEIVDFITSLRCSASADHPWTRAGEVYGSGSFGCGRPNAVVEVNICLEFVQIPVDCVSSGPVAGGWSGQTSGFPCVPGLYQTRVTGRVLTNGHSWTQHSFPPLLIVDCED